MRMEKQLAIETCDRMQEATARRTQCIYLKIVREAAITWTKTKQLLLRTCPDCLMKMRCSFLTNNIIYVYKIL
jgi:hypothetical protein